MDSISGFHCSFCSSHQESYVHRFSIVLLSIMLTVAHMNTHICIHIYIHTQIYAHIHVHTYVCIYVCIYIYTSLCIYNCIHTCKNIQMHLYVDIHTQSLRGRCMDRSPASVDSDSAPRSRLLRAGPWTTSLKSSGSPFDVRSIFFMEHVFVREICIYIYIYI